MKKSLLLTLGIVGICSMVYAMDGDNKDKIDFTYKKPQNGKALDGTGIYYLSQKDNPKGLTVAGAINENTKKIETLDEFCNVTGLVSQETLKKVKEFDEQAKTQLNGFGMRLDRVEREHGIGTWNKYEYGAGLTFTTTVAKFIRLLPHYTRTLAPIGTFAKEIPLLGSVIQHSLVTSTAIPAVSTVANFCTSYYCLVPTTIILGGWCMYDKYKNLTLKEENTKSKDEKALMEQRNKDNNNGNQSNNSSNTNSAPQKLQPSAEEGIKIPSYLEAAQLTKKNIMAAIPTVLKHAAGLAILGYITSHR